MSSNDLADLELQVVDLCTEVLDAAGQQPKCVLGCRECITAGSRQQPSASFNQPDDAQAGQ